MLQSAMLSGEPLATKMTEHSSPNVSLTTPAISATNYSDVLYNVYGNSGKTKDDVSLVASKSRLPRSESNKR